MRHNDQKFMNLALNLARKNIGFTKENPSVGCVIVKDNIILATGITSKNGRPHAEQNAIKNAKSNLTNSTIYITLEPCFHVGKTEPCVDLIIKNKISRAVIACIDPDLRVNQKSIKKLKENGVQTLIGLFENEAKEINRGFFKAKIKNQPFVTLKLATTLDFKIATKNFESKWITNEKSRKYGHLLRARNNGILIGANTLRKDNPSLDCRIEGLEEYSPTRIILSNKLDLDLNSKIFADKSKIIIATSNNNKNDQEKFQNLGIKLIIFQNLPDLLEKLCKNGINNLLIEGGANIATQFLKENLVDEIYHFEANKILGSDAISAIENMDLKTLKESLNFQKIEQKNLDDDQLTILQKNQ